MGFWTPPTLSAKRHGVAHVQGAHWLSRPSTLIVAALMGGCGSSHWIFLPWMVATHLGCPDRRMKANSATLTDRDFISLGKDVKESFERVWMWCIRLISAIWPCCSGFILLTLTTFTAPVRFELLFHGGTLPILVRPAAIKSLSALDRPTLADRRGSKQKPGLQTPAPVPFACGVKHL